MRRQSFLLSALGVCLSKGQSDMPAPNDEELHERMSTFCRGIVRDNPICIVTTAWGVNLLVSDGTGYRLAFQPIPSGSTIGHLSYDRSRRVIAVSYGLRNSNSYLFCCDNRANETLIGAPQGLPALTGQGHEVLLVSRQRGKSKFTRYSGTSKQDINLPSYPNSQLAQEVKRLDEHLIMVAGNSAFLVTLDVTKGTAELRSLGAAETCISADGNRVWRKVGAVIALTEVASGKTVLSKRISRKIVKVSTEFDSGLRVGFAAEEDNRTSLWILDSEFGFVKRLSNLEGKNIIDLT